MMKMETSNPARHAPSDGTSLIRLVALTKDKSVMIKRLLYSLLAVPMFCGAASITNLTKDISGAIISTPLKFTPLSNPLSNGTYIVNGPTKTYAAPQGVFSNWFETAGSANYRRSGSACNSPSTAPFGQM